MKSEITPLSIIFIFTFTHDEFDKPSCNDIVTKEESLSTFDMASCYGHTYYLLENHRFIGNGCGK